MTTTVQSKRHGTSLLELCIVIGILVLINVVIANTILLDARVRAAIARERDATADALGAATAIERSLRAAVTILPSAMIDGVTVTTGSEAIVFDVPALDVAGNPLESRDRIGIARDPEHPERLVLHVAPGTGSRAARTHHVIARSINALGFRYAAPTRTTARVVYVFLSSAITTGGITATANRAIAVPIRNAPST